MRSIISATALVSLFALGACNSSANKEKDAAIQASQYTIDSMKTEMAKKKVVDSMNEVMSRQYVIPPTQTIVTQEAKPAVAVSSSRRTKHRTYSGHSANTAVAQAPVYEQAAPRKKGWSAKAKGALIGAGTGAAAGAVINGRNRGTGAVIGGVLGAAAGTGAGAIIDKKKGR